MGELEKSRPILGVHIVDLRKIELLQLVSSRLISNEQLMLAFANANTLNIAYKSEEYRDILKDFVVVNDGLGVDIASKILFGVAFKENLNGTDFLPYLLTNLPGNSNIFLFGSRPEVIDKAAVNIDKSFPNINIVGFEHGYISNYSELIKRINDLKVDILLVAMGNPKQEKWIYENRELINSKILIGVGAFLDFSSGEIKRAPVLIRKYRMEWLYRFSREPSRLFKRYSLDLFLFMIRILKARLRLS
jgi:alpha-1,3-mannosyltransferase